MDYVDCFISYAMTSLYAMVAMSPIEWCIGEPMPVFLYRILEFTITLAYNIINRHTNILYYNNNTITLIILITLQLGTTTTTTPIIMSMSVIMIMRMGIGMRTVLH